MCRWLHCIWGRKSPGLGNLQDVCSCSVEIPSDHTDDYILQFRVRSPEVRAEENHPVFQSDHMRSAGRLGVVSGVYLRFLSSRGTRNIHISTGRARHEDPFRTLQRAASQTGLPSRRRGVRRHPNTQAQVRSPCRTESVGQGAFLVLHVLQDKKAVIKLVDALSASWGVRELMALAWFGDF